MPKCNLLGIIMVILLWGRSLFFATLALSSDSGHVPRTSTPLLAAAPISFPCVSPDLPSPCHPKPSPLQPLRPCVFLFLCLGSHRTSIGGREFFRASQSNLFRNGDRDSVLRGRGEGIGEVVFVPKCNPSHTTMVIFLWGVAFAQKAQACVSLNCRSLSSHTSPSLPSPSPL